MIQNTRDLRYMLILDDYSELPDIDLSELSSAWVDIYEQWSEIVGGKKADLALLKYKRLESMKDKYNLHLMLYNAVKTLPAADLVELLNAEGYKVDTDNFEQTMKATWGKIQKLKAQIEMEDVKADDDENESGFDSLIVALEKFQGYGFNQKEMSVRHFANIYKHYKDYGEGRQNNEKRLNSR